jgi:hypothetical protein
VSIGETDEKKFPEHLTIQFPWLESIDHIYPNPIISLSLVYHIAFSYKLLDQARMHITRLNSLYTDHVSIISSFLDAHDITLLFFFNWK